MDLEEEKVVVSEEEKWLFLTKSFCEFEIRDCVRTEKDKKRRFNLYFYLKGRKGRGGYTHIPGRPTLRDLEIITSDFQAICPYKVIRVELTKTGPKGTTFYKVVHENGEIKLIKEIKGVDYD